MIVVCSKPGQLGNRLFIFATFIAFSREYNVRVMNVSFDEYARYFPVLSNDVLGRYPQKKSSIKSGFLRHGSFVFFDFLSRLASRLRLRNSLVTAESLDWNEKVDLDSPGFIQKARSIKLLLLRGWDYRCFQTFEKHAPYIRQAFTPDRHHMDRVHALMKNARGGGQKVIGIHIRHGDYKTFEGGAYYYGVEQYVELMKRIHSLFPGENIRFLVCSNSKFGEGDFNSLEYLPGTGHFVEDLYSLAQCDYLAGPPSTYTLWASFYGQVPLYAVRDINKVPALTDFEIAKG